MALKDALESQRAKSCKFANCLTHYADEDIKTLQEWIKNRVAVLQMTKALRAEYPEYSVVEGSLRSHLDGSCCCVGATDSLWGSTR